MDGIILFLEKFVHGRLLIYIASMLPLIELKGTIPIGVAMGMDIWESFLFAFLGSITPAPFIILLARKVFALLKKTPFHSFIVWIENKTIKKGKEIRKNGLFALFLFVAIPLSGTGVWTGSAIAALFDYRIKYALPVIILGNVVAGLIITTISYSLFGAF